MLLQFIVENFLCFAEESVFSMVATADDSHENHLRKQGQGKNLRFLRTSALYGANAHGKTKFIEALRFARHFILNGSKVGKSIPVTPFRLDPVWEKKPSRFEFAFETGGITYHYGFSIDTNRVLEEWLSARPKSREVTWFERVTSEDNKVQVEFGSSLVGRKAKFRQFLNFVAEGTRPNQLFLTEAVERNISPLMPIYEWFQKDLQIFPSHSSTKCIKIPTEDFSFLEDFLQSVDIGIQGFFTLEENPLLQRPLLEIPQNQREEIEEELQRGSSFALTTAQGEIYLISGSPPSFKKLKAIYKRKDGSEVLFDLEEESSGTQHLISILPILADLKKGGKVYFIDELDRHLHPLLTRALIQSFLKDGKKDSASQLIFTTHDIHLLDLGFLRRDEVWFLEKDQEGISRLFSLANLKVRPDLNIQKGYIQGRFGGIPFLESVEPE